MQDVERLLKIKSANTFLMVIPRKFIPSKDTRYTVCLYVIHIGFSVFFTHLHACDLPLQCTKCSRKFSSARSEEDYLNITAYNTNQDERDDIRLCVFCRLKDPSRTLEQRSGHYLNK